MDRICPTFVEVEVKAFSINFAMEPSIAKAKNISLQFTYKYPSCACSQLGCLDMYVLRYLNAKIKCFRKIIRL